MQQTLATEAFQVIFVGYTGFRFPVFHCPTGGIKASELMIITNSIIKHLHDWEFQIDYVLQDGAEENRQYIHAHFEGNILITILRNRFHGRDNNIQWTEMQMEMPLSTIVFDQRGTLGHTPLQRLLLWHSYMTS